MPRFFAAIALFPERLTNNRGQSAVEYLVVVGILIASLVALPSAFEITRTTLTDKYASYAFGIGISDPPTSAFDTKVAEDAEKVQEVMDVLHDLERFIEHPELPDPNKPDSPATRLITDFEKLLHDL